MNDRGQVLPAYLTAIVGTVAVALAVMQVGSAHVLERRAETASDASALAAAQHMSGMVDVGIGGIGLGGGGARDAAEALADSNEADLVDFQVERPGLFAWRVTATVETRKGVIDGPVSAVVGREVRSTSTARLAIEVQGLPPSPRRLSMEEVADAAGVPYPLDADSALVVHAGETCRTGVDTDRLSDEVKIAVLQVEDAVGGGLDLVSGFATPACLLRAGVALPQLSPATRGDQIELVAGQPDAADELRDLGFCDDGDRFVAPSSLACGGDLNSLVTISTRLVPNP
jgi:hypothetical protein